jgi:hypothetical protein
VEELLSDSELAEAAGAVEAVQESADEHRRDAG